MGTKEKVDVKNLEVAEALLDYLTRKKNASVSAKTSYWLLLSHISATRLYVYKCKSSTVAPSKTKGVRKKRRNWQHYSKPPILSNPLTATLLTLRMHHVLDCLFQTFQFSPRWWMSASPEVWVNLSGDESGLTNSGNTFLLTPHKIEQASAPLSPSRRWVF